MVTQMTSLWHVWRPLAAADLEILDKARHNLFFILMLWWQLLAKQSFKTFAQSLKSPVPIRSLTGQTPYLAPPTFSKHLVGTRKGVCGNHETPRHHVGGSPLETITISEEMYWLILSKYHLISLQNWVAEFKCINQQCSPTQSYILLCQLALVALKKCSLLRTAL